MSAIGEHAHKFLDASETGKGWDTCREYCHPDATFSAQAGALADVDTLEGYTEWMKGLLGPVPDGEYELRSFAVDDARGNVSAYAVFRGTLVRGVPSHPQARPWPQTTCMRTSKATGSST